MSESKHTPGPWVAAAKPSSVVGWPVVQSGTGRLICKINYVQVTTIEPAVGGENKFNWESDANARLIAAAPDLLAALKEAEDGLASSYQVCDYPANGRSQQDRALATVRAAIAKATRHE